MALFPRLPIPFRSSRSVELAATQQAGVYDDPAITSDKLKVNLFESKGSTGTQFLSGLIRGEEYNPTLTGDAALRVYDQMWRSDAQVAALLQVIILPLIEATWQVNAATEDGQDVTIAQFVQDNLFGGMQRSWAETLHFVLLEWLRDGFAVLEKVYAKGDDGLVHLAKLAPRLSKTIYRWYPNDNDELDRIQQRVYVPDETGISGSYQYPVIPAAKLAVFTHEQEGNNWAGKSILRPVYKHWFFKTELEKLVAVAGERMAAGIPVATEPPGPVQKSDRDAAAAALTALHVHEKAYLILPNGWTFDFKSPTGMDLLPLIEYHSLQMVRSVLAQFLNLDKGGSYALSLDVSSFFLQALHAKARYIRDQFNAQIIKPLVDLNFATDRYPTLEVSDLDKRDIDKYLAGLAAVLPWLTKNGETENAVRSILGLPDLPADATPAGGDEPTVETSGQGAAPNTEIRDQEVEAGADASEQPTPDQADYAYPGWLAQEVTLLLQQKPAGITLADWTAIVATQADAMRQEVAA